MVPSAVLALDLALRADRAGFAWRVHCGSGGERTVDGVTLPLWRLRDLAVRAAAAEPAWAPHLDDVMTAERHAAAARLN